MDALHKLATDFAPLFERIQLGGLETAIVMASLSIIIFGSIVILALAINSFSADERLSLRDRTWLRLARVRIQNDRLSIDHLAMQRAFMAKSKI